MEKKTNESFFLFWQKWLFYTSIIFAIAGVDFAFLGNSFLFQSYNTMLAHVVSASTLEYIRNSILSMPFLYSLRRFPLFLRGTIFHREGTPSLNLTQ